MTSPLEAEIRAALGGTMTDREKAPERIWAFTISDHDDPGHRFGSCWTRDRSKEGHTSYIRGDLAKAQVAAALKEAAKYHDNFLMTKTSVDVEKVVASKEAILALIPGDAQSAFDRAVAEAVAKERERCAEIAAKRANNFHSRALDFDGVTAVQYLAKAGAARSIAAAIRGELRWGPADPSINAGHSSITNPAIRGD